MFRTLKGHRGNGQTLIKRGTGCTTKQRAHVVEQNPEGHTLDLTFTRFGQEPEKICL